MAAPKRPLEDASNMPTTLPAPAADDGAHPNIDYNEPIKWNCNQVRTRLRTFLDNSGMRIGELQKTLGVTPYSFRTFMAQTGAHKGAQSSTYEAAYWFFREREERGEKMPRKKRKVEAVVAAAATTAATDTANEAEEAAADEVAPTTQAAPAGGVAPAAATDAPTTTGAAKDKTKDKAKDNKKTKGLTDFGDISIKGQEKGAVRIFDSCDEIRKKITAYLNKTDATQAGFLRDIGAQFPEPLKIQGKQLSDFRGKHGATSGNTSRVYYGSYVFFERLRLKEGKPKSKHRTDMEKAWPGGMDTEHRMDHCWLHVSETAYTNSLGQLIVQKR